MKVKKKLFWIVNFSALTLFTMYALSGVFGWGSKQAYAATLENGAFYKNSHNFVVVHNDNGKQGLKESVSSDEEICSLTPTQAAELDAFFKVKYFDIKISSDNTVQVAAVSGRHLTKNDLMDFLKASDQSLDCKLVGVHHVFFLPVIPQIS